MLGGNSHNHNHSHSHSYSYSQKQKLSGSGIGSASQLDIDNEFFNGRQQQQQQQQQQQPKLFQHSTMSTQAPSDEFQGLLQLPKPTDRSHKQKLKLEKQKRRSITYEGELEPEGIRGQQAQAQASPGGEHGMGSIRSFDKSTAPQTVRMKIVQKRPQSQMHQLQPNTRRSINLETIAEASGAESNSKASASASDSVQSYSFSVTAEDDTNTPTRRVSPHHNSPSFGNSSPYSQHSQPSQTQVPNRRDPPGENSFESSSTSSSDDIQHMMQDFLKGDSFNFGANGNGLDTTSTERSGSNNTPTKQLQQRQLSRALPSPNSSKQPSSKPLPTGTSPTASTQSSTTPSSSERSPQQPLRTYQNQQQRQRQQHLSLKPPIPSLDHLSSTSTAKTSSPQEAPLAPRSYSTTNSSNDPKSIDDWNAVALQHVQDGEFDMALAAFQHVLRAYKQQYGNVHPLVASAYHNLGTVHAKRAQLLMEDTLHQRHCRAQSLQCFQSAARAARDSLGRDHPNVAVSLVRIGFLLLQARQYNNAVITFQEALRIRQAHYGPHHPLVANLYNNLGVCYMHLGQFAHGRDLLHHALTIQRTLLSKADTGSDAGRGGEEKKDHLNSTNGSANGTGNNSTTQALELADTLFNIGGLALEWIRRQGPDIRHAEDAEAAFEECLELRLSVLDSKNPLVLQVKSLLEMAQSIPRPKSPGRQTSITSRPTRGNGNVNFQPHFHANARPPDPVGVRGSQQADMQTVQQGLQQQQQQQTMQLSPPRAGPSRISDNSPHFDRSIGGGTNQTDKPSSPYRHYGAPSSPHQPHQASQPSSQQQFLASLNVPATSRNDPQVDYLEPPRVDRRSLLDSDEPVGSPEKPRHALSPTMDRMSAASSSASTVKVSPSNRGVPSSPTFRSNLQHGIFRQKVSPSEENPQVVPPPVAQVTVSQDEDDDGLYNPAALPNPAQTNVFVSPHYVPKISSHKAIHNTSLSAATGATFVSKDSSVGYSSSPISPVGNVSSPLELGGGSAVVKQYSYDAEESLLVTTGAPPSPSHSLTHSDYDGMNGAASTPGKVGSREIMVVRPYRNTPGGSTRTSSGDSRRSSESPSDEGRDESTDGLHANTDDYASHTSSWSRANQAARSKTLNRARELLEKNQNYLESPEVQLSGRPSYMGNSPDRVKQRVLQNSSGTSDISCDEDIEDGLAPLSSIGSSGGVKEIFHSDMLANPQDHLFAIYEVASKCMKNHRYDEAVEYFEVILKCQRRKHGPLHQDVASALHNCGLSQLRAGKYHEAAQSFQEAVRIRKEILGKDHSQVASSLVKCGITYLLLHRFEDSLFALREALEIRKQSLGPLHPSTARIMNNIGCVHVEFNDLSEARRAFEGALDIQRSALQHDPASGPLLFGCAATLCNLGYLYGQRGMNERAAHVLREAADIQQSILGPTHPTCLSTLDSLAEAFVNSGHAVDAYETYETILERYRSIEKPGSRRLLRAEAGLYYKMSRAAEKQMDKNKQIRDLHAALRAVRSLEEFGFGKASENLEKRILSDLRHVREAMEAHERQWI